MQKTLTTIESLMQVGGVTQSAVNALMKAYDTFSVID